MIIDNEGFWWYYSNHDDVSQRSPFKAKVALPIRQFGPYHTQIQELLIAAVKQNIIAAFKVIKSSPSEELIQELSSKKVCFENNKNSRVYNNPFTLYLYKDTDVDKLVKLFQEIEWALKNVSAIDLRYLSQVDLYIAPHISIRQEKFEGVYIDVYSSTKEQLDELRETALTSPLFLQLKNALVDPDQIERMELVNIPNYPQTLTLDGTTYDLEFLGKGGMGIVWKIVGSPNRIVKRPNYRFMLAFGNFASLNSDSIKDQLHQDDIRYVLLIDNNLSNLSMYHFREGDFKFGNVYGYPGLVEAVREYINCGDKNKKNKLEFKIVDRHYAANPEADFGEQAEKEGFMYEFLNFEKVTNLTPQEHGSYGFVHEITPGITLHKWFFNSGVVHPYEIVLEVMLKLIDALGYIHKLGVIHGDVKISNIMIYYDDNGELTVRLFDYNFAAFFGAIPTDAKKIIKNMAIWTKVNRNKFNLYWGPARYSDGPSMEARKELDYYPLLHIFEELYNGADPDTLPNGLPWTHCRQDHILHQVYDVNNEPSLESLRRIFHLDLEIARRPHLIRKPWYKRLLQQQRVKTLLVAVVNSDSKFKQYDLLCNEVANLQTCIGEDDEVMSDILAHAVDKITNGSIEYVKLPNNTDDFGILKKLFLHSFVLDVRAEQEFYQLAYDAEIAVLQIEENIYFLTNLMPGQSLKTKYLSHNQTYGDLVNDLKKVIDALIRWCEQDTIFHFVMSPENIIIGPDGAISFRNLDDYVLDAEKDVFVTESVMRLVKLYQAYYSNNIDRGTTPKDRYWSFCGHPIFEYSYEASVEELQNAVENELIVINNPHLMETDWFMKLKEDKRPKTLGVALREATSGLSQYNLRYNFLRDIVCNEVAMLLTCNGYDDDVLSVMLMHAFQVIKDEVSAYDDYYLKMPNNVDGMYILKKVLAHNNRLDERQIAQLKLYQKIYGTVVLVFPKKNETYFVTQGMPKQNLLQKYDVDGISTYRGLLRDYINILHALEAYVEHGIAPSSVKPEHIFFFEHGTIGFYNGHEYFKYEGPASIAEALEVIVERFKVYASNHAHIPCDEMFSVNAEIHNEVFERSEYNSRLTRKVRSAFEYELRVGQYAIFESFYYAHVDAMTSGASRLTPFPWLQKAIAQLLSLASNLLERPNTNTFPAKSADSPDIDATGRRFELHGDPVIYNAGIEENDEVVALQFDLPNGSEAMVFRQQHPQLVSEATELIHPSENLPITGGVYTGCRPVTWWGRPSVVCSSENQETSLIYTPALPSLGFFETLNEELLFGILLVHVASKSWNYLKERFNHGWNEILETQNETTVPTTQVTLRLSQAKYSLSYLKCLLIQARQIHPMLNLQWAEWALQSYHDAIHYLETAGSVNLSMLENLESDFCQFKRELAEEINDVEIGLEPIKSQLYHLMSEIDRVEQCHPECRNNLAESRRRIALFFDRIAIIRYHSLDNVEDIQLLQLDVNQFEKWIREIIEDPPQSWMQAAKKITGGILHCWSTLFSTSSSEISAPSSNPKKHLN